VSGAAAGPGDAVAPGAEPVGRAAVVGLGLIGGSVAVALRTRGWHVTGTDSRPERVAEALRRGIVDVGVAAPEALPRSTELTVVATPVLALADGVRAALAATDGLVTDVGSVKAPIADAVGDPRFCPGHPMAGSELEGLDGADASLFEGAVWVLTPTAAVSDEVFGRMASVVRSLGAEVVALPPEQHDALVAVISHVPHLTAATLMNLASGRAEDHAALLKLAAGGFRDMTRIASGHPAIWPDICAENRAAIVDTLDALVAGLARVRALVAEGDRSGLLDTLARARAARTNLPSRVASPDAVAEVRVPIPDRPGSAAEVFLLAAELGVNVVDFEVFHSAEGDRGVMILLVDAGQAQLFRGGLMARGYRPSVRALS
jgi:prephenate dehydrogenase